MVLVGLGLDAGAHRMVSQLADRAIDIRLVTFHGYVHDQEMLLARQVRAADDTRTSSAGPPGARDLNRKATERGVAAIRQDARESLDYSVRTYYTKAGITCLQRTTTLPDGVRVRGSHCVTIDSLDRFGPHSVPRPSACVAGSLGSSGDAVPVRSGDGSERPFRRDARRVRGNPGRHRSDGTPIAYVFHGYRIAPISDRTPRTSAEDEKTMRQLTVAFLLVATACVVLPARADAQQWCLGVKTCKKVAKESKKQGGRLLGKAADGAESVFDVVVDGAKDIVSGTEDVVDDIVDGTENVIDDVVEGTESLAKYTCRQARRALEEVAPSIDTEDLV